MKHCIKCDTEKDESGFTPRNGVLQNVCRACQSKNRMERKHQNGQKTKAELAAYMREYRIKNREAILEQQKTRKRDNPHSILWRQLLTRKHNLDVTREDFCKIPIPETCPALGIPISYDLDFDNIPSVDRIDPNKPYSIDNIAIISYRANMIKSVGSAVEHDKIARWLFGLHHFEGRKINRNIPRLSSTVRFGRAQEAI